MDGTGSSSSTTAFFPVFFLLESSVGADASFFGFSFLAFCAFPVSAVGSTFFEGGGKFLMCASVASFAASSGLVSAFSFFLGASIFRSGFGALSRSRETNEKSGECLSADSRTGGHDWMWSK